MQRLNVFTYTTSPVETTHYVCPSCGTHREAKFHDPNAKAFRCDCGGKMSDYQAAHEHDGSLYIIIPPKQVPGPGIPVVEISTKPASQRTYLNIVEKVNFRVSYRRHPDGTKDKISILCDVWHVDPDEKQLRFLKKLDRLDISVILHSDLGNHPDINASVRNIQTSDLWKIEDNDIYAFIVLSKGYKKHTDELPPVVPTESESSFSSEPPISQIQKQYETIITTAIDLLELRLPDEKDDDVIKRFAKQHDVDFETAIEIVLTNYQNTLESPEG